MLGHVQNTIPMGQSSSSVAVDSGGLQVCGFTMAGRPQVLVRDDATVELVQGVQGVQKLQKDSVKEGKLFNL